MMAAIGRCLRLDPRCRCYAWHPNPYAIDHFAGEAGLVGVEFDRLADPIVRFFAIGLTDRIGIGAVQHYAPVLAGEVEDWLAVAVANFLDLETLDGDADGTPLKVSHL